MIANIMFDLRLLISGTITNTLIWVSIRGLSGVFYTSEDETAEFFYQSTTIPCFFGILLGLSFAYASLCRFCVSDYVVEVFTGPEVWVESKMDSEHNVVICWVIINRECQYRN